MTSPASDHPQPWKRETLKVGEWTVTALSDGFFRLDGGSMWGVVPATLWRQMTPPAEDNTILLALRPFLLECADRKVIIEGGVGDRWSDKLQGIYHIQRTTTLEQTLGACGVTPAEITDVVASHCHWDHIGSLVVEQQGELCPLFPNARHHMPRVELEMARHPDHARRGSYRAEDVLPLEQAGLVVPFEGGGEGGTELLDGICARQVGGHSDGVSVITINESGPGETAVFWADVVPTTHHIQPPYIMAYDVDVVRSFEQRSLLLAEAAEKSWIGLFYHDPDHSFGRIHRDGRRYTLEPVVTDPVQDPLS